MTHLDDVSLSAFSDGELGPGEAEAAKTHLETCPQCASRLEQLKEASAAFRRSGAEKMPAGLSERAKAHAKGGNWTFPWELVAVLGTVTMVVLVSGAMLKKFMPSLFNNTQTMITGAAGQMGQDDDLPFKASTATAVSRSTEAAISPSTATVRVPRRRKPK